MVIYVVHVPVFTLQELYRALELPELDEAEAAAGGTLWQRTRVPTKAQPTKHSPQNGFECRDRFEVARKTDQL
jgi:hypothetical protein